MEKEYYQEQIAKIQPKSEYGVTIQLIDDKRNTNRLILNETSAKVLIEWLQKNFIKDDGLEELWKIDLVV